MTTVTCAEDLMYDAEFKGFLLCWQRDKRAPIGLADWLRERDLHAQGLVADWAASAADRPSFSKRRDGDGRFGPTPLEWSTGYEWLCSNEGPEPSEYDVLFNVPYRSPLMRKGMTFTQAIVVFLDHYKVEWADERAAEDRDS